MAQALTTLKETVTEVIKSRLANQAESPDGFLKMCTPIWREQASVVINGLAVGAGFSTKTGVGAPAATEARSFGATTAPVVREKLVKFEEHRLMDLESLAMDIADLAWTQAWNEIDAAYFTLIGAATSTAHPDNGVSGSPWAATGGGSVYAADSYDMTFLDGSNATQTNAHALALSSANLSTVLAKRRTYKSVGGKADLEQFTPYLVAAPALETLAKDLARQEGRLYDGSGLQSGFAGRIKEVVIANGSSTFNAGGWALVYAKEAVNSQGQLVKTGPIAVHIRQRPRIKIEAVPGSSDISVYTDMAYSVVYAPECDSNLFYSQG